MHLDHILKQHINQPNITWYQNNENLPNIHAVAYTDFQTDVKRIRAWKQAQELSRDGVWCEDGWEKIEIDREELERVQQIANLPRTYFWQIVKIENDKVSIIVEGQEDSKPQVKKNVLSKFQELVEQIK